MIHDRPHAHPCQICGVKTPCDGNIEQNYGGWPAWTCSVFHMPVGGINPEWICERCFRAAETQRAAERAKQGDA